MPTTLSLRSCKKLNRKKVISLSKEHNTMTSTGREILHKMKVKAGLSSSASGDTGKGKSKMSKHITHGYHTVEGKSNHAMEDYVVSDFKQVHDKELGLFAIFDGHLGHDVASYLQTHLFDNILKEAAASYWKQIFIVIVFFFLKQHDFWTDTESAIRRAYRATDAEILENAIALGKGGSTAVTAILINGQKLVVANVGDSRAVMCKNGVAKQLSVDHEPSREKGMIESRGGFVSNIPGDVPRVDGQLAVARAFGNKSLKIHLSSEPDMSEQMIHNDIEFLILASDGIWKVMSNQEAVDCIKHIKDAHSAAKNLVEEALSRKSKDDISCIVVRFR
ncbi:probable protein phosphatase 2C 58 isoform X1 [Populus trichocarpa]|uniref:probable protein phosphatase 2C 58 isoform X1 n=1 Tax=Populus trichocarpa TaxID=3694 RepID=UPI002277C77E|nr:probable protein phosphatase 2C 58 isoform X1 [Populus trichocarpa]